MGVKLSWLPWLPLGVGALIAVVLALPYVAPSIDGTTALGEGGAVAGGVTPDFGAHVGSQLHPLIIGVATVLAVVFSPAAALTAFEVVAVLTALAVLFGIVRGGLHLGGWVASLAACLFVASRPEIVLAAASAYVDIAFAAALLIAAALAAERPVANRIPVLALLLVAGLLRPESWSLGVVYLAFLFAAGLRGRELALPGALAIAPIAGWMGLEALLEGDPFAGAGGVREAHGRGGGDTRFLQAPDLAALPDRLDQVLSAPRFTLAMALFAIGGLAWRVVRPVVASRRLALDLEQRTAVVLALVALAVLAANLTEQVVGLPVVFRFLIVASICIVLLGVWAVVRLFGPRLGALALAAIAVLTLPIGPHLSRTGDYLEQTERVHDSQHQLLALTASERGAEAGAECKRFGISTTVAVDEYVRARLDEGFGLVGLGYGVDPFGVAGVPDPAASPGVAVFVREADGRWTLAAACEAG